MKAMMIFTNQNSEDEIELHTIYEHQELLGDNVNQYINLDDQVDDDSQKDEFSSFGLHIVHNTCYLPCLHNENNMGTIVQILSKMTYYV